MKLKNRLWQQSLWVAIITVVITGIMTLLFGCIFAKVQKMPAKNMSGMVNEIVLKNGKKIYSYEPVSDMDLQNLLLSAKMEESTISFHEDNYEIQHQVFSEQNDTYEIFTLYTLQKLAQFYRAVLLFAVGCFLLVFFVCMWVLQRKNQAQVIRPLVHLKSSAEQLTKGDVDVPVFDEGCGEIQDLSVAIEQLRLALKASVVEREKSEENRKFLMSSISHDLKTPVTAIRGYVEGVIDGVANTEEKRNHYLQKAVDKTILMSHMIEDLLLYTKLDLNQIPFQFERVAIAAFMESALEDNLLSYQREEKNLCLVNELEKPVTILADVKQLQRVVQNVLDNARKHIETGEGNVVVTIRPSSAGVILEFADNGEGISPENLPHIFERFYRGDSARRVEGSSGLGLAISKQLVCGMRGNIWAVSELHVGTRIMISFPRADSIQ